MKKITFLFTIIFAISVFSYAETHIPAGNVSGNWAFANSPYIINGEISIQLGDELAIEPGVQVLFSGHYKFNIYGQLLAQGTEVDTIVFTAQDTIIGWHSLRFWDTNTNGQDSSKVVYCKLEYGKATGSFNDDYGGAIYFENASDILIKSCLITNNSADSFGGGISCGSSSPNLENVTITGNSAAYWGGGIYCGSSSPILANVTITGNSANSDGGISCNYDSSPILTNVTITGNSADWDGGGISCYYDSSPILSNVTITGNSAYNSGGGIFCWESSLSLENTTITGNSAYHHGGGISCRDNSNLSFNPINPCNIFLNYASVGNDLYASNCPIIDVIVDTFTVLLPNDYFSYPIDNFTFDILNGKIEQENQDLYVSPIGSNNNSGLTPDDPLLTISYALAKIIADNTNPHIIYLSNGTYSPSQTGEIFPLNCRSYVSLQGEDENFTILDGEGLSGILFCKDDNIFSIENLTIKNGSAYSNGGGIYCRESSPSLANVTITGNSASEGSGIYCKYSSSPSLNNVTIKNNSASYRGGGIYCYDSSPILTNSTITGNSATYDGGGISSWANSSPILINISISGNYTNNEGGGIYCHNSSPILENVTITGNYASDDGGGIYSRNGSNPSLLNCILWNDFPQEIYLGYQGSVTVIYSDIQGNWAGTGNIDADPLFADPANGDFHLSWANFPIPDETKSPCIDAGDPNSPLDPDGTIADMGAFYFDQSQVTQQIDISTGYSFVSSYIIPDNPDILIVMADVLNDNLDFVRNSQGSMLRKIGPNWVNGIGDWVVEEGYLVKMNADDSFSINGTLINPTTPIPVEIGFQFVSYFLETPMDAMISFETIIGDDLDFVRNSQGQTLRKIGPIWVNGIGDCQPGEGYLVKMFADGVLIYPGSSTFTCGDSFTDPRDEQTYNTVQIGDQCWMAENLNIGEMINGSENMTDNGVIEKYCYDNDPANCEIYGGLYQWNEIMEYTTTQGVQGICPAGWSIPTDNEWTTLTDHLGGISVAGGKMKEVGTIHWNPPNTGATNESRFTALPGGSRELYYNNFYDITYSSFFWSSTYFNNSNMAWGRNIYYDDNHVFRGISDMIYGYSIRCLQDNPIVNTNERGSFDNLSSWDNKRSYELSGLKRKNNEAIHFVFKEGNPAEAVYTIYVKGIEIGDEVAAYDGNKMIGSVRINSQNAFENELPVFSTLINGQGYKEGNPIILKLWSENKLVPADFTMESMYDSYVSDVYPEGDGKYSIVNIIKASLPEAEEIISIYPNPATENISIISTNEIFEVSILNGFGQSVYESQIYDTNIQINTSNLESGIYIIRIKTINGLKTQKFIIK